MKKIISNKRETALNKITDVLVNYHKEAIKIELGEIEPTIKEIVLDEVANVMVASKIISESDYSQKEYHRKLDTAWEQINSILEGKQKQIVTNHILVIIKQIDELTSEINSIIFDELESSIDVIIEFKGTETTIQSYQKLLDTTWEKIDAKLEEKKKQVIEKYSIELVC